MKWDEDDEDDYGEDFLKLTKDGRMLLIYLDGLYTYSQGAFAYVLLDADGKLESWGGFKPFDHTLFDGHDVKDALTHMNGALWGLAEDDDIYLLDDGRILVTYSGHESGELLASVIFDPRNP